MVTLTETVGGVVYILDGDGKAEDFALSLEDAARALHMSERTVRRRVAEGRLSAVRDERGRLVVRALSVQDYAFKEAR
jgi:excisionase family DNA binding protein